MVWTNLSSTKRRRLPHDPIRRHFVQLEWGPNCPGGEVRSSGERVGFEVVTLDGRTCPLASTTISTPESCRWPSVGKYKVDVASFESLALPELQVREDSDLFIIDEVGKMELYSSSFFPAVLKVLESNIPVLASIPIPKFGRDIPAGIVPVNVEKIGALFLFHPKRAVRSTCFANDENDFAVSCISVARRLISCRVSMHFPGVVLQSALCRFSNAYNARACFLQRRIHD
ncbi:hypothetical protein Ahy_Scaffold1g107210 [Arachis hypogaea]|uniref:Uncharacterized protein n=1 Tax=Arachis hypogaea TaxID=3818 RepID=A0A444WV05_ARAHY|nr:hypothetical protein Ahy_Scaffold1g107210 [Arachis hypogaea]